MPSIFDSLLNPEITDQEQTKATIAALKRQQAMGQLGQLMGVAPTVQTGDALVKGAQTSFGDALQAQSQARAIKRQSDQQAQQQKNWEAVQTRETAQWNAEQKRLHDVAEQGKWQVIADPVNGGFLRVNPTTGERQRLEGQNAPGAATNEPQMFNTNTVGKPTEQMRNDLNSVRQQRASIQGAVTAAEGNPQAFGFRQGAAEQFGGDLGSAFAQWTRNPQDASARAYVLNNVSTIINARAGSAQSAQELARLRGFLPSDIDDVAKIKGKFNAFLDYLDEKEAAVRGYTPQELGFTPRVRPASETAPAQPGQAAPAQPGPAQPQARPGDKYLK